MSLKYHENRAMLLKTSKLLLGRLSDSQQVRKPSHLKMEVVFDA